MNADPYEGAPEAVKLLLRAEGLLIAIQIVAHALEQLPPWAWLRRRAVSYVGQCLTTRAAGMVADSERADALCEGASS